MPNTSEILGKYLDDVFLLKIKILIKRVLNISFSLNDMDKAIIENTPNTGFYLEIGGNDGVTQSNTYLLSKGNWNGILIEPNYLNFKICKHIRPKDIVINSACTSFQYTKNYIYLSDENLKSTQYNLKPSAEKYIAPADCLNNILKAHDAPHTIDFFSLDVEGAELEVLKGIDYDYFQFKLILIEARVDPTDVSQYLSTHGYQLFKKLSHHDYLFKKIP